MGIFYGDKIFGVRWVKVNVSKDYEDISDIIFELKFNTLTQQYMNLVKDSFNKINETDEVKYYFFRNVTTTHEWCSNSDEVLYYMWVKATKEDMTEFITKNTSL